ncbi:tetratricopeptide repeat protein [Rhizorhabdus argentea]|uniref:tetratricopeptide repeat protein n=1 Tax=Rhizorhabdus argentea TaxID=1387174 RepID=UPI0030EE89CC
MGNKPIQLVEAATPTAPVEWTHLVLGLAVPVAVIVVSLAAVITLAIIYFGRLEFRIGFGEKWHFSAKRQGVADQPGELNAPPPEPAAHLPPPEAETGANASLPAEEETPPNPSLGIEFFTATNVHEIDQAYADFRLTLTEKDFEFWDVHHQNRRGKRGAHDERENLRRLAEQNPTWVLPHASLIDWAVSDGDADEAGRLLAAGLSRAQSPQIDAVLTAGLAMHFRLHGEQSALNFCVEWLKSSLPDRVKGIMLSNLAELLQEAGKDEGYRVASEMALLAHPVLDGKRFRLAYHYGEHSSRWSAAVAHYKRIIHTEDSGSISENNLGVLYRHFDKEPEIDAFERAVARGDNFAVANLAKLLTAAGFVAASERLLNTLDDPKDAGELYAAARSENLAARRATDEKREQIDAIADADFGLYRNAVSAAFRRIRSGAERATGMYASSDTGARVLIQDGGSLCTIIRDGRIYSGTLNDHLFCRTGRLMHKGESLLGSSFLQVTLLDQADDKVVLVQWPTHVGPEARLAIASLDYISPPQLAIEPPKPGPQF